MEMNRNPETAPWKKSNISLKYPTYRDILFKSVYSWLDGKRIDDNAEGLWRIHDGIYDLTDFVHKHPGGSSWLEQTKGTDITEAFESHHISRIPEKLLEKYKVRNASKPRNFIFTFDDNGFYRTLKSRIRKKLETLDYKPAGRSDMIHSTLLTLTFVASIESAAFRRTELILLSGLLLCWTVISSHNYFHKRDNWRMYAFNLSFMSYREWRVSHALSHHMYTNSFHDLEMSLFEPMLCWIPNPYIKNWFQRYISWIYGPVVYTGLFIGQFAKRLALSISRKNALHWDDLVVLCLPFAMYTFSGAKPLSVLGTWLGIETVASYLFGLIGLNAAHHLPNLFHDGDAIRKDRDWGLFQMDAIADRSEIKGSQFLVLTHFGDHGLHHLFPTIDHGILPQLYPTLYETLEDFKGQLLDYPWLNHIIGQHKQLARNIPNTKPPGN